MSEYRYDYPDDHIFDTDGAPREVRPLLFSALPTLLVFLAYSLLRWILDAHYPEAASSAAWELGSILVFLAFLSCIDRFRDQAWRRIRERWAGRPTD